MPLNARTPAFYGLCTVCIIILFYAYDAGRVRWQGYARLSGYWGIGLLGDWLFVESEPSITEASGVSLWLHSLGGGFIGW